MLCRKPTPDEKKRRNNQAKVSIFNDWKNYTNFKAYLCGADEDIYKDWYELSADKIRMHVGLDAFDGVLPSPRKEINFERRSIDTVNGNDLANETFGGVPSKAERRRGMFKSFFGCQYPRLLLPSKKSHPNFKIDPFFKHILVSFKSMWDLGEKISFDEATRGFKRKNSPKSVIKFKKEGDGYLLNCISDDGFIYTFPLRKTPAPKKWVDKGFCPTKVRVLFLFDKIPCKFHICYLENLFMSTNIGRTAYVELEARVKMNGVTREKYRGLPKFAIQQEETKKLKKTGAIGKIKEGAI